MTDKFYLFANCNFIPGGYVPWQAAYDELAVHVFNEEPTTMTYYFGIPFEYKDDIDATTLMFAFEVYGNRNDLYQTHFNSSAMGKFMTKIPPTMTTGLDLMHYELVAGYIDKPGDKTECALMQDTRIVATSPDTKKAIVAKLKALAADVEAAEEGIYTWMAFSSLDDETGLRIYTRFASREAMEKYQKRKDVLDFWFAIKEQVKQMEWRCYVPNGKGWLHR